MQKQNFKKKTEYKSERIFSEDDRIIIVPIEEKYINILQLDKNNINYKTIKKAYFYLANKYHPDKPGGDIEKFHKISEAYDFLKERYKS